MHKWYPQGCSMQFFVAAHTWLHSCVASCGIVWPMQLLEQPESPTQGMLPFRGTASVTCIVFPGDECGKPEKVGESSGHALHDYKSADVWARLGGWNIASSGKEGKTLDRPERRIGKGKTRNKEGRRQQTKKGLMGRNTRTRVGNGRGKGDEEGKKARRQAVLSILCSEPCMVNSA
eukprot:360365-Chlamydomonas_euryale.AAC.4